MKKGSENLTGKESPQITGDPLDRNQKQDKEKPDSQCAQAAEESKACFPKTVLNGNQSAVQIKNRAQKT